MNGRPVNTRRRRRTRVNETKGAPILPNGPAKTTEFSRSETTEIPEWRIGIFQASTRAQRRLGRLIAAALAMPANVQFITANSRRSQHRRVETERELP